MPVVWDERHRGHAPGTGIWLGVSVPGDEEPERGDALGDALAPAARELPAGDRPRRRAAAARARTPTSSRTSSPRTGAGSRRATSKIRASRWSCRTCSRCRNVTSGRPCARTHGDPRGRGAVRDGHDDADRARHVRRARVRRRRRAHRVRPRARRRARRLRRGPAARPPRRCRLLRRLLLPQQRGRGRAVPARSRRRARRGHRHRRAPRQRHPGDLLRAPATCSTAPRTSIPAQGWFPHFVGFADEQGAGDGTGANRNIPLPPGAGDEEWLRATEASSSEATAVDGRTRSSCRSASTARPPIRTARSRSRPAATRRSARRSATLNIPTVLVQEGGYVLDTLGDLVLAALRGFEGRP